MDDLGSARHDESVLAIGYLTVRFNPDDLPRGVVIQEDLSEFQMGLQDIVEGIVRSINEDDSEINLG
jgi:hypothetical protein